MSLYMSKQTKKDFINSTWAAKTIQGWKDGATKAQRVLYYPDDFPNDTAKGIRLSVHVYANSTGAAIEEAFTMYLKAKMTAMDNKIPLAPVEGNNNK
jgi:hypothetical protein